MPSTWVRLKTTMSAQLYVHREQTRCPRMWTSAGNRHTLATVNPKFGKAVTLGAAQGAARGVGAISYRGGGKGARLPLFTARCVHT